ncbi:DUF2871 domain-containing protein [Streptomyces mirabilis]|uniref:DUF2871 domain-containing protein n=1 Tax=Streptomyces mirabilis TaxID=68239 RepID=UPI0036C9B15C
MLSGLFYREFTKVKDFTGDTQLSVLHTHLLALGMLVFLIVLGLDKVFQLSESKLFTSFFWFYNAGIVVTVGMMGVHGTMTVLGHDDVPEVVPLVAGLGHILLTVGLVLLFIRIDKRLKELKAAKQPPAGEPERATTSV